MGEEKENSDEFIVSLGCAVLGEWQSHSSFMQDIIIITYIIADGVVTCYGS